MCAIGVEKKSEKCFAFQSSREDLICFEASRLSFRFDITLSEDNFLFFLRLKSNKSKDNFIFGGEE